GFWADAWERVLRRPSAIMAIAWISIVGFFAVFSPLLANGHPLLVRQLDGDGTVVSTSSPLLEHLTPVDILLLIGALVGLPLILLPLGVARSLRLMILLTAALQVGLSLVMLTFFDEPGTLAIWITAAVVALPFLWLS